ncbi:MAG: NAD-dependent epimerase/dehydratase family protein [Ilumatobacteraceae bacterium]
MRILFAGGTGFVGRAMAVEALSRGHHVTLLHRGNRHPPDVADAEHLLADRDGDLSLLAGRRFDATIDVCAYVPRQVDHLADALGDRGGHHVFVSTVSVYQEPDGPGLVESAPLATVPDPTTEVVDDRTYGGLKVLCEQRAAAAYGASGLTVVRPTYVIGPHDHTLRFPYWVRRIASGGTVLAPGPADAPMQTIDARDQASWTLDLAEGGVAGMFTSADRASTFGAMLDAIVGAIAPAGTTLEWVDGRWLVEQGEDGSSLPLWCKGGREWALAADPAAAFGTGLRPRPLTESALDTQGWLTAEPPVGPAGRVDHRREAELLAAWAAR